MERLPNFLHAEIPLVMRPLLLLLSLLVVHNSSLFAQPNPPFFQYSAYQTFANPAIPFEGYNGLHNLSLNLTHRMESAKSFNEGPNAQVFNATWIPMSQGRFRLLLGGSVVKKQFGPTSFTDLFFRLGALNFSSPDFGKLAAALNLGFNQFSVNAKDTKGLAPNDPLLGSNYSDGSPNIGLGVYYRSSRIKGRYDIKLGISVPQAGRFDLVNYSLVEKNLTNVFQPQYFGLVGVNIYQGEFSYWELSSWIKKYAESELEADFMGKLHFEKPAAWLGVGFSTRQSLRAAFGLAIWYFENDRSTVYQTKGQYFKLEMAYNSYWGNVPNQLNNGLELQIAWLLPQI